MTIKHGNFVDFAEELRYLFKNGSCILFDEDNMHDAMVEFLDNNRVRYTKHMDRQFGTGLSIHVFFIHEDWKER